MKITLLRTGGILPLTQKAEKEVKWTSEEMEALVTKIKIEDKGPGEMRDATTYHLMYDAETFPIDWEKIPSKYKKIFDELKQDLKVVKPG